MRRLVRLSKQEPYKYVLTPTVTSYPVIFINIILIMMEFFFQDNGETPDITESRYYSPFACFLMPQSVPKVLSLLGHAKVWSRASLPTTTLSVDGQDLLVVVLLHDVVLET